MAEMFYKIKEGNARGHEKFSLKPCLCQNALTFPILIRLLNNYLYSYDTHVYLTQSTLLQIKRRLMTNVNLSSLLLTLCKHTVHISVNECLLLMLPALTFSSPCYAIMNQTLLKGAL